jgi:hypothetical protein
LWGDPVVVCPSSKYNRCDGWSDDDWFGVSAGDVDTICTMFNGSVTLSEAAEIALSAQSLTGNFPVRASSPDSACLFQWRCRNCRLTSNAGIRILAGEQHATAIAIHVWTTLASELDNAFAMSSMVAVPGVRSSFDSSRASRESALRGIARASVVLTPSVLIDGRGSGLLDSIVDEDDILSARHSGKASRSTSALRKASKNIRHGVTPSVSFIEPGMVVTANEFYPRRDTSVATIIGNAGGDSPVFDYANTKMTGPPLGLEVFLATETRTLETIVTERSSALLFIGSTIGLMSGIVGAAVLVLSVSEWWFIRRVLTQDVGATVASKQAVRASEVPMLPRGATLRSRVGAEAGAGAGAGAAAAAAAGVGTRGHDEDDDEDDEEAEAEEERRIALSWRSRLGGSTAPHARSPPHSPAYRHRLNLSPRSRSGSDVAAAAMAAHAAADAVGAASVRALSDPVEEDELLVVDQIGHLASLGSAFGASMLADYDQHVQNLHLSGAEGRADVRGAAEAGNDAFGYRML